MKEGGVKLRFVYVLPGGPGVKMRDATKLVRELIVTVEVAAAEAALAPK
jgi:hypothetical protein